VDQGDDSAHGIAELEPEPDVDQHGRPGQSQGHERLLSQVLAHLGTDSLDTPDLVGPLAEGLGQGGVDPVGQHLEVRRRLRGPDQKLAVLSSAKRLDVAVFKLHIVEGRAETVRGRLFLKLDLHDGPAGEVDAQVEASVIDDGGEPDADKYDGGDDRRLHLAGEIELGVRPYQFKHGGSPCAPEACFRFLPGSYMLSFSTFRFQV